jgi:hypothetical protein
MNAEMRRSASRRRRKSSRAGEQSEREILFYDKRMAQFNRKNNKTRLFDTFRTDVKNVLILRNGVTMGDIDLANFVSHLVIYMVVLLLAISAHEAGHAWMSYKFGDDTAFCSVA